MPNIRAATVCSAHRGCANMHADRSMLCWARARRHAAMLDSIAVGPGVDDRLLSAAVGALCGLPDPADRRPVREHVRGHDQALNRLPQAYQGGRRRRRGRPTRWEHALGAWRVWRASAPPSAALRAAQAAATRAEVTMEYRSNCVRVGLWRCRPMDKWTRGPCLRCWVESFGALGCMQVEKMGGRLLG